MKKSKYLYLLFSLLPSAAILHGQDIQTDIVHDFSNNTDTLNSEIRFVYADSSLVVAAGNVVVSGNAPGSFVAGFDYNGNLLWEHLIAVPAGAGYASVSGTANLKKTGAGLYVIGGVTHDTQSVPGDTLLHPFLYFFNAAGDSLNYISLSNTLFHEITALSLDQDQHILMSGLDIGHEYWVARLDATGTLLLQKHISQSPIVNLPAALFPPSIVNNIIALPGNNAGYLLATTMPMGYPPYIMIRLDSLMNYRDYGMVLAYDCAYSSPEYYEMVTVAPKNSSDFYFFAPAIVSNETWSGSGIYYGKLGLSSSVPFWSKTMLLDEGYFPDGVGFPFLDHHLCLNETANGDLILQKTVAIPDVNGNYLEPGVIRTRADGTVKWAKSWQHFTSNSTAIAHFFNSQSIAPDGRIISGGYIDIQQAAAGVSDIPGKISWLSILSDPDNDTIGNTVLHIPLLPDATATVYPNPSEDIVYLKLNQVKSNFPDFRYQVCGVHGRILMDNVFHQEKETIPVKLLEAGLYFIKLYYEDKPAGTLKLVKR